MKRSKTTIPPLFQGPSSALRSWTWRVMIDIGSNGYARYMTVEARRVGGDPLVGRAEAVVPPFFDVHEVMECLATEAMLASTEPTLWDETPTRTVDIAAALT